MTVIQAPQRQHPTVPLYSEVAQSILALDLGTATGYALRTPDGAIASGTVSFRPSRYDGGGMRYLRFRGWLAELAKHAGGLTAIYFEEVRRHLSTDAAHVHGGLLAILDTGMYAEVFGNQFNGIPRPATVLEISKMALASVEKP